MAARHRRNGLLRLTLIIELSFALFIAQSMHTEVQGINDIILLILKVLIISNMMQGGLFFSIRAGPKADANYFKIRRKACLPPSHLFPLSAKKVRAMIGLGCIRRSLCRL